MPNVLEIHETAPEVRELAALEQIFDQCQSAWRKATAALLTIREKKLWKAAGYSSWNDYCQERWGFGGHEANRKIVLAKIVHDLTGQICPDPEQSHVAELAGFPPDMRAEIYDTARSTAPGGKLTAAWIEQTGRRLMDARMAHLKEQETQTATVACDDEEDEEPEDAAEEDGSEEGGEAEASAAPAEEEGEEEEAPPRAAAPPSPRSGPQRSPPTADDRAIQEAAEHPITQAEEIEKWQAQGKRWARKGGRLVLEVDCTPAILARVLPLLEEDGGDKEQIRVWQAQVERWANKGERLALALRCTPQDLLERFGS